MKKNVVLIFGGKSTEHDISIVSASQVVKSFNEYLYNIYCVYISKSGEWKYIKNFELKDFKDKVAKARSVVIDGCGYLLKQTLSGYKKIVKIDVVFPVLHGLNGEDGAIKGYCNMLNIPCVCGDIGCGAVGLDKAFCKKIITSKQLNYIVLGSNELLKSEDELIKMVSDSVGFPCIIKPARMGSSIGIEIVKNSENLLKKLTKCIKFDKKLLIEPYIEKIREFNIALFKSGNDIIVSEIEEPIKNDEILSFSEKYLNFSGNVVSKKIPPNISKRLYTAILDTAKQAYNDLNCCGVIRVDFIYDKLSKELYVNEINTIPGSLALYLFEAGGYDRKEVITKLINEELRGFYSGVVATNYATNVLDRLSTSKFQNK